MILRSIKLENIRSYLNQLIEFPEGTILLSGDIGSGKSTILLALEFALFGVRRKHLSGESLLRHGKKEGSVEVKFDIDSKEIIIKRNLKRGKSEISQESGYIIRNGIKKEATAIELKSDILELLGYPQELLTKSKDMIFRYTVYTPQEEMKQILLEDKEIRLDTLRKVFNIDKYKKIRENSLIYSKHLKEEIKEGFGNISDLEEKKKQKDNLTEEIEGLNSKIKDLLPSFNKIKLGLEQKKRQIKEHEEKLRLFNEMKFRIKAFDINLKNFVEKFNLNKANIEKFENQIKTLEKELEGKDLTCLIKTDDIVREINRAELDLKAINSKLSRFSYQKIQSIETVEKISTLQKCPTCEQDVTIEHKNKIEARESKKISESENNINRLNEDEKNLNLKLQQLKSQYEQLRKKEVSVELLKLKSESLKERIVQKEELEEHQKSIKKEIGNINSERSELAKGFEELKDIEGKYNRLKQELDDIQKNERKIELETVGLEKEKSQIEKHARLLADEIEKKLKIKEKIYNMQEFQNWLENMFFNLMATIEKHVMLQIYREFNELFQNWFNMLIEDETINVRLDEDFTPVIVQNGYETELENLSGGEKTSVALAYRLALNKVINELVANIKTNDLIILDEPTDGFSSEQLDRIRDVIDQLNNRQIIIVSHESKIESYVDNIIRISKSNHVSRVENV